MKTKFNHILQQKQKGMTLLEAIVSFLVVGFGLAMTVSMLQASNRYGASAEYRAIAMREMQSIVEQMRANPLGYEGYFVGGSATDTSCKDKSAPDSTCTLAKILQHKNVEEAVAMAKEQRERWLVRLRESVPGIHDPVFTPDPNKANSFSISVSWTLGEENKRTDDNKNKKDTLTVNFSL